YIDPDSYRYISMYVGSIYGQTGQQLLAAGETEKAKKLVLDAYQDMPKKAYLMSDVMSYVPLIEVMFKVGETAKAGEIVKRNLQFVKENMAYYEAVAETKSNLEFRNMRYGLASIQRYKQLLDQVGSTEDKRLSDELYQKYIHYFQEAGE